MALARGRVVATFSIAAADPERGEVGVAVASKFLAVGSVVPWARAGVGAVATQAMANTAYGERGLGLLAQGIDPAEAIDEMVTGDPDRDGRQVGVVHADGRAATFTGPACLDWAGGRTGPGYACQGNILAGAQVVDAMAEAFEAAGGRLAERLMAALAAGDAAGGDRRGRQSAALYVAREGAGFLGLSDRFIDLRVDDHEQPIPELARILDVHASIWGTGDEPPGVPITGALQAEIAARLGDALGIDPPAGFEELGAALAEFARKNGLEGRLLRRDGRIDAVLLEVLRGQ